MIDDFLDFHKKNLSHWALILQYMKLELFAFPIYILMDFMSIFWIEKDNSYIPKLVNFILFLVGLALLVLLAFRRENVVRTKYQGSLSKEKFKRTIEYLNEKGLKSENYSNLVQLLLKEAENRKLSGLLFQGGAFSLFLILWTRFIGWFYDHTKNVILAMTLFLGFCFMIFLLVVFFKIIQDYFDSDSKKLKEIALLIEEKIEQDKLNLNITKNIN